MSGGERICCNVHTLDFHGNVSVDLTSIGYTDLVDGFFVEVDGMTYELDINEIY